MLVVGVLSAGSVAFAMPDTSRVPATNTRSGHPVVIPAHAVQVAENVFSLGSAVDPQSGKKVEGYMIISPKPAAKKPDGALGGGKPGSVDTSSCYGFLAKDAKWKSVESWVVDPTNPEGLSEADVFALLDESITKWEDAADGSADNVVSTDILGVGSIASGFAEVGVMDGVNGVRFGSLDIGTIGVTTIWGVFGGAPAGRELVEWDQVYNTYYSWNVNGSMSDMDFESIATHELGHSVGMADLYTAECSEETMYGYGSEGETKARDLNAGDITGISKLY